MATEKRLIDVTEPLKLFRGWIKQLELPEDAGDKRGVESCIDILEDEPTVDAVEVIHGEWRTKILCGGFAEEWGYVCSVCGCTVSDRSKLRFGKFATGNQKLNYCPNCGADMRGDGDG